MTKIRSGISKCSVTRPCKPPYQHLTTAYHDWTLKNGHCRFCGKTRAEAMRPAPALVLRLEVC